MLKKIEECLGHDSVSEADLPHALHRAGYPRISAFVADLIHRSNDVTLKDDLRDLIQSEYRVPKSLRTLANKYDLF